jgi:MoxR-like ATPase
MALPMVKAFVHALASGQRYYFVGEAGIGKTSFIKAVGDALGYDVITINAANLGVENLFVPFPVHSEELDVQVLETLFFKRFAASSKKVIFIDEIGRADQGLANTLMELLQEGTLAGRPIPGLVTVLAADNPQGSSYGRMSGLDFSQADRFATVKLDANRQAIGTTFVTEVVKDGKGELTTRVLRKVDNVEQMLGMKKEEFQMGTRDVPACP